MRTLAHLISSLWSMVTRIAVDGRRLHTSRVSVCAGRCADWRGYAGGGVMLCDGGARAVDLFGVCQLVRLTKARKQKKENSLTLSLWPLSLSPNKALVPLLQRTHVPDKWHFPLSKIKPERCRHMAAMAVSSVPATQRPLYLAHLFICTDILSANHDRSIPMGGAGGLSDFGYGTGVAASRAGSCAGSKPCMWHVTSEGLTWWSLLTTLAAAPCGFDLHRLANNGKLPLSDWWPGMPSLLHWRAAHGLNTSDVMSSQVAAHLPFSEETPQEKSCQCYFFFHQRNSDALCLNAQWHWHSQQGGVIVFFFCFVFFDSMIAWVSVCLLPRSLKIADLVSQPKAGGTHSDQLGGEGGGVGASSGEWVGVHMQIWLAENK